VPLQAVLVYPADYDATKKYPMVVFIYEVLSSLRHQYVNPTLYNGIGFNVSTLSLDGYFVLLPDISYEKGDSGVSAADCVVAATKKVLALGIVNPKQIGLTGQSFGGYETNFILTQTNLFAAAVSGSAVSDTVQHYFTINKDYNTIDGWRYENQQYRMGCSFFDCTESYLRNSALLHADAITTPLLTWAGKLDENVNSRQAEGLYAALRRLEKEHVMLVYNTEGHIFSSPENQSDLTLKINDWFGHYLKGAPKANWMQTDLERK
jgi:dipeptidyl aminopeptidase/acylaminoacyl peptidase